MSGIFGGVEFVGGFGEDAGDVEGDVADADDGDVGGGEVPGAVESGVAVVEAYEVCCAVGSVEVFAGDVEVAVGNSAGGEDDSVVVFVQLSTVMVVPISILPRNLTITDCP